MKKGIVFPLVGMIVIILSIIVMIGITNTGDTFTKRVILKGEVASSNLNEIEAIRKMLPVAIEPIAQRVSYESGQNGGGYQSSNIDGLWTATEPTDEFLASKLAYEIGLKLPGTESGNYDRTIDFFPAEIEITRNEEGFEITGHQTFSLKDSIIRSNAVIDVPLDKSIKTSYFKLADIGRLLFIDSVYQNIINLNEQSSERAIKLQNQLILNYPDYDFRVSSLSNTQLQISITDSNTLVPARSDEEIEMGIEGNFHKLTLIFSIIIPAYVQPAPDKVNPVYLNAGWNYVKSPYLSGGEDVDELKIKTSATNVEINNPSLGWIIPNNDYVIAPDDELKIKVPSNTIWYCDSRYGVCP